MPKVDDDAVLPPLRPHMEIQRAHDILTDVLASDLRREFDAQTAEQMTSALHALCWVLNHENDTFGVNLHNLVAMAQAHGIVWEHVSVLDAVSAKITKH